MTWKSLVTFGLLLGARGTARYNTGRQGLWGAIQGSGLGHGFVTGSIESPGSGFGAGSSGHGSSGQGSKLSGGSSGKGIIFTDQSAGVGSELGGGAFDQGSARGTGTPGYSSGSSRGRGFGSRT